MTTKYIFAIFLSLFCIESSHAQTVQSFKDELFSLKDRKVLEAKYSGAVKRYYWDEMLDVNGRDAVPGVEAKPERIDLSIDQQQRSVLIKGHGTTMDTYEVGEPKDAKFAVIFIHGSDGSKELGASDTSFGGNFNRIKNLSARSGGVYYSPTVTFDNKGTEGVKALIRQIKKKSPNAKIVISCASAGAFTCWQMADDQEMVDKLSGMAFIGGADTNPYVTETPAFKSKLPMVFSHGTKDKLVDYHLYEDQFEIIHKANPNYPARLELFDGGKHGTPMRMFDWKEQLEWMFAQAPASTSNDQPVAGAAQKKHWWQKVFKRSSSGTSGTSQ